jgi:hypothetical protein
LDRQGRSSVNGRGAILKQMRTPEQIKEFIFINHHLMTNQEMSDELGVSYEWVTMLCADNNLKAIKTKDRHKDFIMGNQDLTIEECAEVLGVTYDQVRKLNKELGEPLLSNKKRELRDREVEPLKTMKPVALKPLTRQEEQGLMNVLAEIVRTMTPEEKKRFAEKYIEL